MRRVARRFARYAFTLAAILSVPLCAAMLVLWWRSPGESSDIRWVSPKGGYGVDVLCVWGGVRVELERPFPYNVPDDRLEVNWHAGDGGGPHTIHTSWLAETLGFDWGRYHTATDLSFVSVPYWAITLASAVLPLIAATRVARRLVKRRPAGVCPACGYDLRATPHRCPECGTVPPTPNARDDDDDDDDGRTRRVPRLLTLASAVSLVLCVAVCAMWVRSHVVVDRFTHTGERRENGLSSTRGRLVWESFGDSDVPVWPGLAGWERTSQPADDAPAFVDQPQYQVSGMLGFRNARDASDLGNGTAREFTATAVPYWPIVGILLPLPLAWLAAVRRRRRARCATCGDDAVKETA